MEVLYHDYVNIVTCTQSLLICFMHGEACVRCFLRFAGESNLLSQFMVIITIRGAQIFWLDDLGSLASTMCDAY